MIDMAILRETLEKLANVCGSTGVPNGVNEKVTFSDFPIHIASIRGDIQAIEMLIKAGADIDALGEHDYTALHEAVEQGHSEVVKILLNCGANQNLKNINGYTPFELAELLENESVIAAFTS